jgi:amino acid adenylation domain-containing protein
MQGIQTFFGGELDIQAESLNSLFESVANILPDAVAISTCTSEITYKQLYDRVLKYVSCFESLGLTKGDVVGVHVGRSEQYAILTLATMLGGFVYLPLAVELPNRRIQEIIDIANPIVVVSSVQNIAFERVKTVPLEVFENTDYKSSSLLIDYRVSKESLCYIIFTSGSSGSPKGVKITHGAFLNRLLWAREYYQLICNDVIISKTPFTFDPSIQELVLPLIAGSRLHIANPERMVFPNFLIDTIIQHDVTMLIVVPSLLRIMLQSVSMKKCKSLRHVVCCGEPWSSELITDFYRVMDECDLYNGYGPTEATIGTLVFRTPRGFKESKIPIGTPIKGTHVAIVDEKGCVVRKGDPGELIIGGVCVSDGYLKNDKLNFEKYKTLSVESHGKVRFYFSGDVAKVLPSNEILYIGRKDNQVKVNGVRIELEEVENVLRTHCSIEEVAVFKTSNGVVDSLVALFVSKSMQVDVRSLRIYCQERLGRQVIPAKYSQIESMRYTSNGKIDRNYMSKIYILEN